MSTQSDNGAMTDAPRSVFPVFVFERRHEIETSERTLAGGLSLNIFGWRRPTHRQRLELAEIIRGLAEDARAGRLPLDGVVIGWPGDERGRRLRPARYVVVERARLYGRGARRPRRRADDHARAR